MTNKEQKVYKEDLFNLAMEQLIGGSIDKLNNKNKKLLKDFKKKSIELCMFTLHYCKNQFLEWCVEEKDYELNPNFDRLIYIINENLDICSILFEQDFTVEEYGDYGINIKASKDLKSYDDTAKEVGL